MKKTIRHENYSNTIVIEYLLAKLRYWLVERTLLEMCTCSLCYVVEMFANRLRVLWTVFEWNRMKKMICVVESSCYIKFPHHGKGKKNIYLPWARFWWIWTYNWKLYEGIMIFSCSILLYIAEQVSLLSRLLLNKILLNLIKKLCRTLIQPVSLLLQVKEGKYLKKEKL